MLSIPRETYLTLLIFDRLDADWVREIHRYVSQRKQGKTFVIFRNSDNKTLHSLDDLKLHYQLAGKDAAFLAEKKFQTGSDHDIVSNKVGANKRARKSAQRWITEVNGGEPEVIVTEEEKKAMEEEAAARKKAIQEAARKRLEEKAAEKKLAEEVAAAKKIADEEAAAAKKIEEEVAAKKEGRGEG